MIDYSVINLENTINSGQVFLWTKQKEFWYGINGQDVLKINNSGKITSYSNKKYDFFRNSDDIEKIIKSISKDKTTKIAVKKYLGLRLVKQDPFQCFISFIVSSNSNIQKIKSSLEKISIKFGKKIQFDNKEFYMFPEPKKIANATIQEIQNCGVGYRAKFIIDAAKIVESKQIDFDHLKKINYQDAKEIILTVPGIGNKVADCILLFSLDKLEAFPLDRWMIRILERYYLEKFELKTKSITEKQYDILHEKIIKHFGPYAGYAQQFLFKMERENYQKKWL
ncbi:8-oxoguanine DNA glycosylase [Nitrosopumilaceae archaeon]|nr:8-oxoguanine DNA glycosylase [Nitrosopumilaceae archaeon]